MELWDVYDENRKLTGKTHERGVPLGPGEYHIIADVWTVNQRSEILLTRRHPDKPYGLLWECTGGSVLTGENSVEGALRELSEEVDTYITRQNVNLEDLKLQAEEVVDAKFVVFDELMEMWRQGIVVPKSRFLLYKDKIENFIRPS